MTLVAIWGSINSFPKISLDSHFYESPFSKATLFFKWPKIKCWVCSFYKV